MGAWGVGMRANDTALDAIEGYRTDLKRIVRKRDALKAAELLKEVHADCDATPDGGTLGLLGAAEYLLDAAGPEILAKAKALLEEALDRELSPDSLDCWRNEVERQQALDLFRRRLNGETVDPQIVERTNEGLLSRLVRKLDDLSTGG